MLLDLLNSIRLCQFSMGSWLSSIDASSLYLLMLMLKHLGCSSYEEPKRKHPKIRHRCCSGFFCNNLKGISNATFFCSRLQSMRGYRVAVRTKSHILVAGCKAVYYYSYFCPDIYLSLCPDLGAFFSYLWNVYVRGTLICLNWN